MRMSGVYRRRPTLRREAEKRAGFWWLVVLQRNFNTEPWNNPRAGPRQTVEGWDSHTHYCPRGHAEPRARRAGGVHNRDCGVRGAAMDWSVGDGWVGMNVYIDMCASPTHQTPRCNPARHDGPEACTANLTPRVHNARLTNPRPFSQHPPPAQEKYSRYRDAYKRTCGEQRGSGGRRDGAGAQIRGYTGVAGGLEFQCGGERYGIPTSTGKATAIPPLCVHHVAPHAWRRNQMSKLYASICTPNPHTTSTVLPPSTQIPGLIKPTIQQHNPYLPKPPYPIPSSTQTRHRNPTYQRQSPRDSKEAQHARPWPAHVLAPTRHAAIAAPSQRARNASGAEPPSCLASSRHGRAAFFLSSRRSRRKSTAVGYVCFRKFQTSGSRAEEFPCITRFAPSRTESLLVGPHVAVSTLVLGAPSQPISRMPYKRNVAVTAVTAVKASVSSAVPRIGTKKNMPLPRLVLHTQSWYTKIPNVLSVVVAITRQAESLQCSAPHRSATASGCLRGIRGAPFVPASLRSNSGTRKTALVSGAGSEFAGDAGQRLYYGSRQKFLTATAEAWRRIN
ncbi:hypothetical protein EJ07DRAFT_155420 [Lizonia empirigonia]|nr:hypothetical protein EJ07DRAFT_155420 [Lizonia empirigonia]